MSPEESIYQACLLRFRPIMMTTMAALLGALPLAIGTGTGSELRRPLGIAVVGGLLVSQFLTLYTTPVIYLVFARLERRFGGLGARAEPTAARAAESAHGEARLGPRSHALRGSQSVNFSEIFIRRPVATVLLTIGPCSARHHRLLQSADRLACRIMDRPTIAFAPICQVAAPTRSRLRSRRLWRPAWAHFRPEGDDVDQHLQPFHM